MPTVSVVTCFLVKLLCHSDFKINDILAPFTGLNFLSNLVTAGVLIEML